MAMSQAAGLSNCSNLVGELYTEAEIEALNLVLLERGISAERIVAILPVPAQAMVNPMPPRYRVIYRIN